MEKKIKVDNLRPVSQVKNLSTETGLMKQKAFTLVELIVVITILAILATVGFVSFSGYLAGTRDVNRVAQLKSMSDALELYRTKKDLPIPDDKIDIKTTAKTIAYQGYIGKNVLETIEYTESGLDPKDKQYFSYYLTKNKKYFQLLSFLEEPNEDVVAGIPHPNPLLRGEGIFSNISQATDYTDRHPKTTGKKLGILTDVNNTPIQEIETIIGSGSLDLNNVGTEVYKSIIANDEIITGSGISLAGVNPIGSCKRIKQLKGGSSDGTYTIDPEANGTGFKVYCDMTTDGGGWTKVMDEDGEISDRILTFIEPIVESTKYPGYYKEWKSKILPIHNEIYLPNYCNYPGDWRNIVYWKDKDGNNTVFASQGGDILDDIENIYSHFDQKNSLFSVKCPGNGNNTRRNGSVWVNEGLGGSCVNSYAKGIIKNNSLGNNSIISVTPTIRDAVKCEIWVR